MGYKPKKSTSTDLVIVRVSEMLHQRSRKGMETYRVSLEDDDTRSFVEWLTMAQEELLDGCNYLEKIKLEMEPLTDGERTKLERECDKLRARVSSLEVSNKALVTEGDYLRFELRKDDRDFYDHRAEALVKSSLSPGELWAAKEVEFYYEDSGEEFSQDVYDARYAAALEFYVNDEANV